MSDTLYRFVHGFVGRPIARHLRFLGAASLASLVAPSWGLAATESAGVSRQMDYLVANAPIAEVAAAARGEELLVVGRWLTALGMAGRLEQARAAAKGIEHKLPAAESYPFIAFGLGRAGRFEDARKLLRELSAEKKDQAACAAGRMLIEAKRFEEAQAEIESIAAEYSRTNELAVLVQAMAEAGRLVEAAKTLGAISVTSVSTTALLQPAREALAKALVRDGQVSTAISVAQQTTAPRLREAVLTRVALELVGAGKVDDALALASDFPQRSDQERVWLAAAKRLAVAGRLSEALAVVRKLRALPSSGSAPRSREIKNGPTRGTPGSTAFRKSPARERWQTALNEVALETAKLGRAEEALAAASELGDPGDRATIWITAVSGLAANGHFDAAIALASKSDDQSQRWIALAQTAGALKAAGKAEAALALARKTLGEASGVGSDDVRSVTMGRLTAAFAAAGLVGPAEEALAQCDKEESRIEAILAVAEALISERRYDEAWTRVASLREGISQRGPALARIATAAAVSGHPLAASAASGMQAQYQAELVRGLCAAGNPEQAMEAARGMPPAANFTVPWDAVAVAFARAGNFPQALVAADGAKSPVLRLVIYSHLLTILAVKQNPALTAPRGNASLLL